MTPFYFKAIADDIQKRIPQSPVKYAFSTTDYEHERKMLDTRLAKEDTKYPIVNLDGNLYTYIQDKIIPYYNVIDEQATVKKYAFDYIRTMPTELCPRLDIYTTDISQLALLEEFFQKQYGVKQQMTVAHPNFKEKEIRFNISINQNQSIRRWQKKFGNNHVFVSSIPLVSDTCISYTENYSPAQLELDPHAKVEIIERIAALEKFKSMLIGQGTLSDSEKIKWIDKAWSNLDSLVKSTQGITTYSALYEVMCKENCTPEQALQKVQKKSTAEKEKEQADAERLQKEKNRAEKEATKNMSQICPNCGHELRDAAKFCGRCGTKLGQVQMKVSQDAGWTTSLNKQSRQAKELLKAQAREVGAKNKDFVNSVKDFSNQPKKKKRSIIIAIASLAAVLLIVIGIATFGGFGASKDTVSQAALEIAEQDFGYKLTLTSYNIVDSFTAKGSSPLTGNFKGKAYLVIVEADVLDSSGNVAMSVKYGVEVINPEKKGEYVSYSPFSQAIDCTGEEDSAIIEYLKRVTAGQR